MWPCTSCTGALLYAARPAILLSTRITHASLNSGKHIGSIHDMHSSAQVTRVLVLPRVVKVKQTRMSANLLTLNSSKTKFLIIGLKQQLSKIDDSSLNSTHSARNLGFIFDENLTFSDQISSLSKSCYSHIYELRCIRPYRSCAVPRTHSTFGDRSFALAGPRVWNSLPAHLRDEDIIYGSFKRELKTFRFNVASGAQ